MMSSSSAETIPIQDQFVAPNNMVNIKNKAKYRMEVSRGPQNNSLQNFQGISHKGQMLYVEPSPSQKSRENVKNSKVKFSNEVPVINKSALYRLRHSKEINEKHRENASSVSSSTSFKNLHMSDVNETISGSKLPGNNENYHSQEEENLEYDLCTLDANPNINDTILQRNFFSNDKGAFSNNSKVQRKSLHMKKLSEINPPLKSKPMSPDNSNSLRVIKYLQKVHRGLNTIDRLTLWRSLPNHVEYMKYYRNKKRHSNIKRSEYYLDIKNDVKRTYLHCSFSEENDFHSSLVSILSIYAMRNTEIGYLQGMNFL